MSDQLNLFAPEPATAQRPLAVPAPAARTAKLRHRPHDDEQPIRLGHRMAMSVTCPTCDALPLYWCAGYSDDHHGACRERERVHPGAHHSGALRIVCPRDGCGASVGVACHPWTGTKGAEVCIVRGHAADHPGKDWWRPWCAAAPMEIDEAGTPA